MNSYGQRFGESVECYLRENKLLNGLGVPSLGLINRNILEELADRFEEAERRRDKGKRTKNRAEKKPETNWKVEPSFDWRRVAAIRWPLQRHPDRRVWEKDPWALVPSQIKRTIHAEGREILATDN